MEGLTSLSTQIMNDEDFARMIQSEESGFNSILNLPNQLNEYNLSDFNSDNKGTSMPNRQSSEDNDNSVIIIDDDDSDESLVNKPSISNTRDHMKKSKSSKDSNASISLNRNDLIRSDEILARKIQEDFDREFAEIMLTERSKRSRNSRQSNERARPLSSIQSDTSFLLENRSEHTDSLQDAYRILNNSSGTRRRRNENLYDSAMHPSIEQDVFNLVTRNISSNELRSRELNRNINRERNNEQLSNMVSSYPGQRTRESIDNNRENNNLNLNFQLSTRHFNSYMSQHRDRLDNSEALFSRRSLYPNQSRYSTINDFILGTSENIDYEELLRLDERNVKKKVSKQELDSLFKFTFRTIKDTVSEVDKSCSICFEDYESRSNLTALVCSHKFHSSCIKKWLNQNRRCPLCQKDAINGT